MLPPEVRKAYRVARDLFSEPGVADRADSLTAEACCLAGKRMATISALRFLAARGNEEAAGFIAALEYPYAKPLAQRYPVWDNRWTDSGSKNVSS
jgi:hypothetical protein